MVSSLGMMVARQTSVPVLDPRLATHTKFRVVNSQTDEPVGSEQTEEVGDTAAQQPSTPNS